MCVVSMIGDFYRDKWEPKKIPDLDYIQVIPNNPDPSYWQTHLNDNHVTRAQYELLKKEVQDMKALLRLAVEYDKRTGQPDCEVESKIARLREVAKAFKIDIDEILK